MREKYKNKYRIASTRLKDYDYSQNGMYFVTICAKDRKCCFGDIIQTPNVVVETPKLGVSTGMQLSEIGKIAEKYWLEIPNHFSFVELDEFIIMPNHIHGILVIDRNVSGIQMPDVETPNLGVSTRGNQINHWVEGCLGVIINQYKRICTINIRKKYNNFAWQSRFYEHIIDNENVLDRVREYVQNNPYNWQNDRNNTMFK